MRRNLGTPANDFYGTTGFSKPETLKARKVEKQKEVRSAGGTEVLASTEVWLLDEIRIGDEIDGETVQDRENVVGKNGRVLFWKAFT